MYIYIGAGLAVVLSTILLFYPKGKKMLGPHDMQSLPSSDWNPAEDAGLVDSEGNPISGGPPRRHKDFPQIVVPAPENDTLCKLFNTSVQHYRSANCLGFRQELGREVVDKTEANGSVRQWQVTVMTQDFKFFSYDAVARRIQTIGTGFRKLGITPGEKFAIFEETRLEWMLAAQACFSNSIVVVTVYTNLGDEALLFSLNEGAVKYLMTTGRNIKKLLQLVGKNRANCPSLEYIIYTDTLPDDFDASTEKTVKIVSLSDVEKHDSVYMSAGNAGEAVEPAADDLAVIMYTSGSTGNPKGVLLTHRQLAGAVGGFRSVIEVFPGDSYLAYLPLAHVLELVAEISMMVLGVAVGYGKPRTLIDNPLSVRPCGDLTSLRPTLMAGVPTVFDRVMKGAQAKIRENHAFLQWLFKRAFAWKASAIQTGGTSIIWDLVFGRVIRNLLGGRVRRLLSGGAPLSEKTDEFLRCAFSVPVSQGYGLTETCGCSNVMAEFDPTYKIVGPPVPSCEIRLVDVPDMKYFSKDTKSSTGEPVLGRGEIWIRGANISSGYYKMEEKTREDFTAPGEAHGWFKTGDIGQWLPNGVLQIIDRKKNLVKTSHGEYIAYEKLESIIRNSDFVANVCVYVDCHESFPIMLVTPTEAVLRKAAKDQSADFEKLCKDADLEMEVLKSVKHACDAMKLKPFEIPRNVRLLPTEWTPEDGVLSSAGKIKRNVVQERYGDLLEAMYKQGERRF